MTRGVLVLAALGTVWLSVRGQHPYRGPAVVGIHVLVAFVVINVTATVAARKRAMTGVRGGSQLRAGEITVLVLSWAAAAALIAGLAAVGASYAQYPTTVLIIPGLAWAAVTAARAQWRPCRVGLAVTVTGAAGFLTGPATSWLVAGAGLCAVLLGNVAVIARQQRVRVLHG